MLGGNSISAVPARMKLLALASVPAALLISAIVAYGKLKLLAPLALLALLLLIPVEMSLGLFALSLPFDNILTLGNSGTAIAALAGALAGVTLLAVGLLTGRLQMPPRPALWWSLFALWSAASVFWASDTAASMVRLPTVITLCAVYLVAVSFRISRRELSWVIVLTILGGVLAAGMALREFASHMSLAGRATLIINNHEANPNDFASSLVLPFSLAIAVVLTGGGGRVKKLASYVALGLLGAAILLTMSRGAMIALAAAVLVFLVRTRINKRVLIAVILIAIPLSFAPSLFFTRWQEAASSRGQGRLDIIMVGAEVIKHNAIIGAGLENFPVEYRKYAGRAAVFRGLTRPAHNVFVHVWGEAGIIGLALLLAAIWSQIRPRNTKVIDPTTGRLDYFAVATEAACWGILTMGMSGNIHWNKTFWFAFILSSLVLQRNRRAEVQQQSLSTGFAPRMQPVGGWH